MAPLSRTALLPQCTSCLRRCSRLGLEAWRPLEQQPARRITNAAKEAQNNVVVKLLQDVKKFGRKGSFVPVNPSTMRNRWFPMRVADYVPATEVKKMKAEGISIQRDFEFGVRRPLVEDETPEEELKQVHQVRRIELQFLSPERSMELLNTFVPPTIDFFRQPIEQEESGERMGSSSAADILSAVSQTQATGIYGSVSTADVAATIRGALGHNDEAARVILQDKDVRFLDATEGDGLRVKQLGKFQIEIKVAGASDGITRTVRVRAKGEKDKKKAKSAQREAKQQPVQAEVEA